MIGHYIRLSTCACNACHAEWMLAELRSEISKIPAWSNTLQKNVSVNSSVTLTVNVLSSVTLSVWFCLTSIQQKSCSSAYSCVLFCQSAVPFMAGLPSKQRQLWDECILTLDQSAASGRGALFPKSISMLKGPRIRMQTEGSISCLSYNNLISLI